MAETIHLKNKLFLISGIREKSICKLIDSFDQIIFEVMFIENAGNVLKEKSMEAGVFLKEIAPWIKERKIQFELNGYNNIVYYCEYKNEVIEIINKYGTKVTDWVYPKLFDGLSFLRESGDPIFHINYNSEPRIYLYENELKKFKEKAFFKYDAVLAEIFLSKAENEKNDFYSWQILSNYKN